MRFLLSLLSTLILLIAATLAIPRMYVQPNAENAWIGAITARKLSLARAIKKPKIIIVGGSNALFGFSAETIERETGIPTVNLATHQGVGPAYHLLNAERATSRGDTVLLAFENVSFVRAYDLQPLLLRQALFFDLQYLFRYPEQAGNVLFGWSIADMIEDSQREHRRAAGGYRLDDLTLNGDLNQANFQLSQELVEQLHKTVSTQPAFQPIRPEASIAVDALRRFMKVAKARGLRVLFVWPNRVDRPDYHTEAYRKYFADLQSFYESLGIEILDGPFDGIFPAERGWDSSDHPNHAWAVERSLNIAQTMKTGWLWN
jgi:hypothetical protein